ncbi:Hypothetical predicted protein [Mytilus galloprovincialis]|uniref:C2H2-type domain-containing protein n=1 Tax=Mytilus galloprovincialis TaxID=29158 RepID=A0A8B6H0D8_MYTGA|nr:Hypothetical predicted protein [Mytilus galloprovincialis]
MDDKTCPVCKLQFSRKDVMMRHHRNKHGITEPYPQSSHEDPPPPQREGTSPPPPPPPQRGDQQLPRNEDMPPPPPRKEETEHFVFKHPFTMTVSGPTSCGKTFFVKQLLQNLRLIQPTIHRILWLYRRWQPLYDEIQKTVRPYVEFIQGIPVDLEKDSYIDPSVRNMIILDDLMSTSAKDPRITDLFTEGSHHRNLSVVVLNQNLYFSKDPTQRRNCHYLVLFNNPVDKQQIMTLGRQMYPGKGLYFFKKFEESTSQPFGYLLLDLKPTTPETNRLLGNVLQQQSSKTKKVIPTSNDIRTVQHLPVPYSYEDGPGEQTYENMPSCDDCGVVLDSMHDLQRHIKHWCPENEYLKRKRDNEDLGNESPSKKSTSEWIKYDSVSDDSSEDVNMDDNEGYKSLLHEAIDTAKDTWDTKYDKYVKEGMNEEDAIQRSNEKISHIVQRQFFKRYTELLKLIVPLDESKVHSDIVQQIQDIAENDTDYETQIRRILMKKRHQFDELFDDDYFEINTDTEDNDDEDDEEDTDEDIQEED